MIYKSNQKRRKRNLSYNILEKKQVLSHSEKKTNAEDEKPQKTYISLDFKVISIIYISLPMTVAQISCLQFLFPHIFSNKHAEFINLLITYYQSCVEQHYSEVIKLGRNTLNEFNRFTGQK